MSYWVVGFVVTGWLFLIVSVAGGGNPTWLNGNGNEIILLGGNSSMKHQLPDSNLTPVEKEQLRREHDHEADRELHRHRWFLVGVWLMALVIFVQIAGLHEPLPWYGHVLMLVLAVAVSLVARASISTIIKVVFLGMWMAYLIIIGFWLIMGTSWFALLGVALVLALAMDFVQLYRVMTGRTPIE